MTASDKAKIMEAAAPVRADTTLSKITIINAVADFYNHRYEWKDEECSGRDIKNKTIRIAAAIGLGPKGYHNLEHALRELEIYLPNMVPIAQLVVTWRESLADYIRAEGKKNGVSIPRGSRKTAITAHDLLMSSWSSASSAIASSRHTVASGDSSRAGSCGRAKSRFPRLL
jgi:hypothetical protein